MGKFLKIFPLDPMFFRTPRPFTAGEQDWAPSNPLPLPGTLYGALRSMILSRRNFEQFVNGSGYEDIGTPENKGTLRLLTFTLGLERDSKTIPYFPPPANLLVKGEGIWKEIKDDNAIKVATPTKIERAIVLDVEGQEIQEFFYLKEDDYEPPTGYWISIYGLNKYLNGELPSVDDFVSSEKFFIPEPKVGIGRDRGTRASEEGRLYRVNHFRYKEEASILAWIEGTDENLNGIFTLGGERRTAKIKELRENPFNALNVNVDSNRFLVYLATPAIFEGGWYPKGKLNDLRKEGIEIEPITAFIPGYKIVSGWDIQKKAPKNLYRVVSERSVYVFEVKNGDVGRAIESFHMKNISDINTDEGYGFALVGTICTKEE